MSMFTSTASTGTYTGGFGYSYPHGCTFSTCEPFPQPKIKRTMKEETKHFIQEHRTIIYWIIILLIADHFIFEGKLRAKLLEIFEAAIERVKKLLEI